MQERYWGDISNWCLRTICSMQCLRPLTSGNHRAPGIKQGWVGL